MCSVCSVRVCVCTSIRVMHSRLGVSGECSCVYLRDCLPSPRSLLAVCICVRCLFVIVFFLCFVDDLWTIFRFYRRWECISCAHAYTRPSEKDGVSLPRYCMRWVWWSQVCDADITLLLYTLQRCNHARRIAIEFIVMNIFGSSRN